MMDRLWWTGYDRQVSQSFKSHPVEIIFSFFDFELNSGGFKVLQKKWRRSITLKFNEKTIKNAINVFFMSIVLSPTR